MKRVSKDTPPPLRPNPIESRLPHITTNAVVETTPNVIMNSPVVTEVTVVATLILDSK